MAPEVTQIYCAICGDVTGEATGDPLFDWNGARCEGCVGLPTELTIDDGSGQFWNSTDYARAVNALADQGIESPTPAEIRQQLHERRERLRQRETEDMEVVPVLTTEARRRALDRRLQELTAQTHTYPPLTTTTPTWTIQETTREPIGYIHWPDGPAPEFWRHDVREARYCMMDGSFMLYEQLAFGGGEVVYYEIEGEELEDE